MSQEEQSIVSELEAQFGAAYSEAGTREVEQLPKMRAVLRITNAFLDRSSNNRKQLNAECEILESDAGDTYVGKTYTKRWGLETAENLQWLNGDMVSLGLTPPLTPTALLELKVGLVGICLTASLVPNTDEQFPPNCYINKGARREDLEGTSTSKEEVPF